MLVLGLTGGIATGKSTVSRILSKHEIPIIDADLIAREVVLPNATAYTQIVSTFKDSTPDLVLPDGQLNRPALGRRIFNDDEARRKLNAITHPAVRRSMALKALKYWFLGHRMIVMDVPLLFESGLDLFCGVTIVVSCSDELQMKRLMIRDSHLTKEDAASRVASQMPMTQKSKLADIVIDNDGSLTDLEKAVHKVVSKTQPWRSLSLLEWLCPPFGLSVGIWTMLLKYLHKRKQVKNEANLKAKL